MKQDMSEIINLWEKLSAYNIAKIVFFYVDDRTINYDFTPILPGDIFSKAWISFNFNINKVIETLNITLKAELKDHRYYIMCDNALISLISAFESYLVSIYNNIRFSLNEEKIDPKNLMFQRKDIVKDRFNEFDIDIAHLNDNLWRVIFSSNGDNRGIIKTRNIIVHNGWKDFENISDMINHTYLINSILKIVQFIKIVDRTIIKKYPNLAN